MTPEQAEAAQQAGSLGNDARTTDRRVSRQSVDLAEQAWDAFQQAYDQSLEQHSGQWVAYHGEQQIGFAFTRTELVQECCKRGLRDDECVIGQILPVIEETPIGLPSFQEDVEVEPGAR